MTDFDPDEPTLDFPGDTDESSADAAPASPDVEPSDHPERIGRYRIEKVLGQGGFGLVYLAYDEQLDRRVAVKVPYARLVSRREDAEAYLTEARTVANLDHPHIVSVFDVGSTDEFPCYIVSKYVEGTDLAIRLKQSRLKHNAVADLVATVAEALHYAHKQGLVHRDVKPGNILVGTDGKPYVVDFGLALREENIGRGPKYAGTPAYMSPEQARGEGHRVDGRSDIYSLGAVFYELLTGRRTFSGETKTDILEQIASQEPKPPRQIDDVIPKELERICLKALSKRASDRYTTALDMAEDLTVFLAEHPAVLGSSTISAGESQPGSDSTQVPDSGTLDSDSQPIRIVPKGLRSFDEHDADFFLELLPGPRDREGLPDSIRFWKPRIEETDSDSTFSVGLIYGPSGCGKSSLVKAGLLPRLSDDVIAVSIESTPDDTESRLLHGLRKRCPDLADNLSLRETLSALRRGEGIPVGKKVLIVLDQFEQWLHAKRDEENTQLVQALRQCDGGQVQCIVMVRDDFWMAVTRFMDEMEVDLLKGQNMQPADLFDPRHAKKVLAAFGRAFGVLPADTSQTDNDQKLFLSQSVAALTEEGKVICVRLALFAEMMKGKPWTPTTFKDVGGAEGVGVTFLEETFSSQAANPKVRLHQKAARAVLNALLPESGTDIKGQMKSYDELLEASEYAGRPQEFDDLVRILDSEIRLITPTDPEGVETDDDSTSQMEAGQKYYQLTHDYLVHSLRDWLTRKQKETRRGRAELRLAERSALWNAKPENRHLPAWWEYANIRLLTDKKNWSQPQRKMMARAARIHGVRWGSALLLTLVIGITIQQLVSAARHRNLSDQVQTTISSLNTSRGIILPPLKNLQEFPHEIVLTELRKQFETADEARKLPLAYALAHFDDIRVDFLVSQVGGALPDEVDNFVAALGRNRTEAVTALENAARTVESEQNWQHKARLAMLALHLRSPSLAKEMCQLRPDPIQRTLFIEECSTWHGDLTKLAQLVAESGDSALRSGVILAVGSVPVADVLAPEKQAWKPVLANWYATAPDTPTHSAAGWALRKWELSLPEIAPSKSPPDGMNWHVNGVRMTLLKIPAGSFVRKNSRGFDDVIDQTVTLTRPFLLADREVSRAQFQQFIDDPDYPRAEKPKDWSGASVTYSPTEQHPVQMVSWYDAVLFCNWLSLQEELMPCYKRTGEKETINNQEYDAWQLIPEANGYRLPTEAEWEYACWAGTVTTFSHGDEESLLDRYAVYSSSRTELPGSKLPNGWGLFDVHGNVYEWCHDWYAGYGSEKALTDPAGSAQGDGRVLRGGWSYDVARYARSAYRSSLNPFYRTASYGFRAARTYR